jgi:hypothetical protein
MVNERLIGRLPHVQSAREAREGEAFLGLAAAFEPTYQLRRLTDSISFALSL